MFLKERNPVETCHYAILELFGRGGGGAWCGWVIASELLSPLLTGLLNDNNNLI